MKFAAIAAALAVWSAAAAAQWAQEPQSIFGIPLGGDQSEVRACPYEDWNNVEPACQVPNKHSPSLIHLYGVPTLEVPYTARLGLYEGKISDVTLQLDQAHFGKFRAVLEERYGRPSSVEDSTVMNAAGARLPAVTLRWQGRVTSITAMERAGSIDRSIVVFASNDLAVKRANAGRQQTKGDAAKL